MKNEMIIENVKFWLDKNIICCKIYSDFDENCDLSEIDEIFLSAITTLSNGKYLPILIDLRENNFALSAKVFKYLSYNWIIKSLILSRTFLVKSLALKALLSIYNFSSSPIIPNTIFIDYDSAIKDCNKNYMQYKPYGLKRKLE